MTSIHTVTTFFNQLNNVITIFRLYNLGNFLRILQTESNRCISRVHHTFTHKIGFTAPHSRATVFRVHTSQSRKFSFSLIHTIRILTQPTFYIFYFSNRNFGLQSNYLHLHLSWYIRNTILWQIFKVTAHFRRSHFDITYEFLLHLLHSKSFTRILTQSFTYL